MYLYHCYDSTAGPFKSLSDLPLEEANRLLCETAAEKPNVQCAKRQPDYMQARIYYENRLRTEFEKKGGLMKRKSPRQYLLHRRFPSYL